MSLEQVALQILLLVISAICSLNYLSNKKSLGRYIPLNTEGSIFELQSAKVSAITSSAKTPKSTVQISIRAATSIWAGPPLALTCSPFDNWLPGCYKGNINKVREARFCISWSSEQLRSHYINTTLAVQELTFLSESSLPPHLHTFQNCVRQTGSQNCLCTSETWAQIVPCIQQP